jgi:hypothetical protein
LPLADRLSFPVRLPLPDRLPLPETLPERVDVVGRLPRDVGCAVRVDADCTARGASLRSDASISTCITLIGRRINFSIARRRGRSELSHNDIAIPEAPARPVRPIRCT